MKKIGIEKKWILNNIDKIIKNTDEDCAQNCVNYIINFNYYSNIKLENEEIMMILDKLKIIKNSVFLDK